MLGTDEGWSDKVLTHLTTELKECRIVALCRYQDQLEAVKKKYGDVMEVPEMVVDGSVYIRRSDVFIGMGGTMTTEAALIGVPTISVYQGTNLYTERYLASVGLLLKTHNAERLSSLVRKALRPAYAKHCARKARKVLDSMEDPVEKIVRYLTTWENFV